MHESGLDDVAPEPGHELDLGQEDVVAEEAWPVSAGVGTAPVTEDRVARSQEHHAMNSTWHPSAEERREAGQFRSDSSASRGRHHPSAVDLSRVLTEDHLGEAQYPQYDETVKANIYLDKPVWPINRRDEAVLFRHYIQKLAY